MHSQQRFDNIFSAKDSESAKKRLKTMNKHLAQLKKGVASVTEFVNLDFNFKQSFKNGSLKKFLPVVNIALWPQTADGLMLLPDDLPSQINLLKIVSDRIASGTNCVSVCERMLYCEGSYDGFHDLWNIVKEGLKASQVWPRVGLLIVLCNVLHG